MPAVCALPPDRREAAAVVTLYGPEPGEPRALRAVRDLGGTPVDDADGRPAGELYGSLAEADGGLIRYLDLSLDPGDRHVLVPIGHAHIQRHIRGTRVRLRAARREELRDIPPYEPDEEELGARYQHEVLAAHSRLFQGERYYAHPSYDHSGLYAGEHPIVEAGEAGETAGLGSLSGLSGYALAADEPDIRGWPVADAAEARIGAVRDLLIDPGEQRVRYAVVVQEHGTGEVLLPVGYLEIEREAERVRTPALTTEDVEALPPYSPRPGAPDRATERRIQRTLAERLEGARRFARPDFSPPAPPA